MNTQHTPGPWTTRYHVRVPEDTEQWSVIHYQGAYPSDTVCAMRGRDSEANARLIAAAPKLLEALETVLTARLIEEQGGPMDEYSMTMTDAIDWARPIVREAKGE